MNYHKSLKKKKKKKTETKGLGEKKESKGESQQETWIPRGRNSGENIKIA